MRPCARPSLETRPRRDDRQAGHRLVYQQARTGRPGFPHLVETARGKRFYITVDGKRLALGIDGKYTPVEPQGLSHPEDVKRRAPVPLAGNKDASLWDMGDGIACLELTTRDNVITPDVVKIIGDAIKLGTGKKLKALVIGNDSDTFSAGADLRRLREAAQPARRNWAEIDPLRSRPGNRRCRG